MMRQILFLYILITISLTSISCSNDSRSSEHEHGDTLQLKYSELLTIVKHKDYTVVDIADPWHDGKKLHTYVLTAHSTSDIQIPEGTVIHVPIMRSIPFTSVHSGLIINLGKQDAIAGVADLKYIKLPYIQKQCASKKIAKVGNAMMPDIETIINIEPDAILISPFDNNGGYGKIEELGIPIIECADYMETSALGRAEWMKFYGMLFGAEMVADSLFSVIDSSYNALKTLAQQSASQRSVIMDKKTGAVWYVPAGRSTIGRMLTDANANYPFAEDTNSGSLSLNFETVLDKAGHADVWLFRYDKSKPITYEDLLSEYHGYSQMDAFNNHECYGCNVETSLFYEETPFRPDYHLNDMIKIIHPDIKGLDSLRYYQKLKTKK